MKQTKEQKLIQLHEKLCDLFLDIVDTGEHDADNPIPSATLKTMTAFLKDNDITCQEEESNVSELKNKLQLKKKLATVSYIDPEEARG